MTWTQITETGILWLTAIFVLLDVFALFSVNGASLTWKIWVGASGGLLIILLIVKTILFLFSKKNKVR